MRNSMKKILFITATPTPHGNGDALIESAMEAVQDKNVEIKRIDLRKKQVNICKALDMFSW